MAKLSLIVNGRRTTVEADPETPLLYVLRNDLGLRAAKFGCGLGQCGACTVLLDGREVRSCMVPVRAATAAADHHARGAGHAGAAAPPAGGLHRAAGGPVRLLHRRHGHDREGDAGPYSAPDRGQVKNALAGNLCRCGTHARIVQAVLRSIGARDEKRA